MTKLRNQSQMKSVNYFNLHDSLISKTILYKVSKNFQPICIE